jgi:hypothetical protein
LKAIIFCKGEKIKKYNSLSMMKKIKAGQDIFGVLGLGEMR